MLGDRPLYRRGVLLYDRAYRWFYGLDRRAAQVGPAISLDIRRIRRAHVLADGTRLAPGERVGVLHLNNPRIAAIHTDGRSPLSVGLEFRRQLVTSLGALAASAGPGEPLGEVAAFSATTIFHEGLARLGFTAERNALAWPRVVATYQRALLVSMHPAGALRLSRATYGNARRLWLSREALLARYGRGLSQGSAGA